MAPSSAAAATGRIKLISLASFGLISGACLFVGYYLLRRYRKATHQETDDSSEEKQKTESVSSPLADDVFDKNEFTKDIVCKTGEEHENERKEGKEKEQDKKKEDDQVQQRNTSAQHVSRASGALNATEVGQRESLKDMPLSADVKESLLHDDSSVTAKTADATAENEQHQAEATKENENRKEKKEALMTATTAQETRSEPRHEASSPVAASASTAAAPAPAPAATEIQTGRMETKVSTKEAPRTAPKPSSYKRSDPKTVGAKTDKEPKPASDNEQQTATAIKQTKASSVHSEKQSQSKGKGKFSETKSVEPTPVQKPSFGTNRNETKAEKATAETQDEIRLGETAETFNEAVEQQSAAVLEPIKATDASTNKDPTKDVKETETTTRPTPLEPIKATDASATAIKDPTKDVKEAETPTPLIEQLQKLATPPETVEVKEKEPQKSSELPRSGKSHIPERVKRSADDRPDLHLDSLTNRKTAGSKSPLVSPTGKDEARTGSKSPLVSPTGKDASKTVWSESHQDLKDSRHGGSGGSGGSGGIGKGHPLNVHAASFRPHNRPHVVDGGSASTGRNKDDHTTETSSNWADRCEDASVASSSQNNSSPAEQKTADHEPHSSPSSTDDASSSEVVARSTKSLLVLAPLTPPPDTNKQSRRNRIRGSAVVAADPAASEGAVENQSRRSRHRWPPLDDNNKNLDRVEVDTNSQQVSWKTNKKFDATQSPSSGAQSPWSSSDIVQEEPSSSTSSEVTRKVEFDDNFVDPVSSSSSTSTKVLNSTNEKTELTTPSDVTKQSSLLNVTPDCVLERKPLISEEDDDDDDDDDNDGVKKQFVRKNNSAKNGNEEQTGETNSSEDSAKLVEIDQNGLGSLIGLAGEKADPDVRLASLRALVNVSWASEKHPQFPPVLDQLCANIDSDDASVKLESLRVLVNLSKNPAMVPHLLAAKAPNNILKLLVPELSEEILINWLTILDDILWTSKELCLTFASLPTEHRAASPETMYTGLYGLKNARILKSRIFVLSRHKSQQVTYLASRIYSCLTS